MSERLKVKRKVIKGIEYFIDKDNNLYDTDSKEQIGLWDDESKTIKPVEDDDDDEEDDDEEDDEEDDDEEDDDDDYPDENDGLYYLSKSTDFFYNSEEKRKPNGDVYYVPTFNTGIQLSNSLMSQDIVKLNTGMLGFGIPVFIETNGLVRLIRKGDGKYFYSLKFINKDGNEVEKRINDGVENIGIFNGRAFVALFGYSKKHTTLETYDKRIVRAFKDYILPKILFTPIESLNNYKQKTLKLPPLEKGLEDAKRDLDAETDPMKQKVIKSLMKKIISSIPEAKEFDDAEIAKKTRYDAEDEVTKQKNNELLAKQKKIKKEIKDREKATKEGKGIVVSLGQAADNISKYDDVYKYSNPKKVQELAKKYLGEGGIIYRSIKKDKKYMVYNPNDKKWVHFGQMKYEDFTKHKDEKRRKNYLTRSAKIKGDWKDDKYSPNNLSRNLLW